MTVLVVALGLVVALLAVLVAGLLRSHAEILRELHDLRTAAMNAPSGPSSTGPTQTRPGVAMPRGSQGSAADVTGTTIDGDALMIGVRNQQHLTLLAFLSSGCLTCRGFWDAFAQPDELGLREDVRLVAVTRDATSEQPALLASLAPEGLPVVMSSEAWDAYDVPVAPYFILVDGPSGRVIGEGASATWPQVRELLNQALADSEVLDGMRRRGGATGARDATADEELLRAGITPGHASLYPDEAEEDGDGAP